MQTSAEGASLDKQACRLLPGVGPKLAETLARCQLHVIQDLLFHLPFRYQDRTRLYPLNQLRPGMEALVQGQIQSAQLIKTRAKPQLLCQISDGTASIHIRFFHYYPAQLQQLRTGAMFYAFGEVKWGSQGLEFVHPEYRVGAPLPASNDGSLTPVYPSTEGLSQLQLRKLTSHALDLLQQGQVLPELIPANLLEVHQWPSLADALFEVHRPAPSADVGRLLSGTHPAQQRLALEELIAEQLSLQVFRAEVRQEQAPRFTLNNALQQALLSHLPFTLTAAQMRVLEDIAHDLKSSKPMLRLIQGDVGSGKTLVAMCSVLAAIAEGWQAAIMAPTEILAEQHYQAALRLLAPLGVSVVCLFGSLGSKARREALAAIADGSASLVIGTHALFQTEVTYAKLGLVVIDEQHRFGVHQRLALRQKGQTTGYQPHQLIMTATPIPRTLAMTAFADLDHSIIDELPPGRIPIVTAVIPNQRRVDVLGRVAAMVAEGRQVYWVCTLIEESEVLDAQAAEATLRELQQLAPGLDFALVHGRQTPAEKTAIMEAFKQGDVDVLVATTVIEVGVDVPNASLMVIENPERLGLAQLHQLRGRVGRGAYASHCVLLYQAPLSQEAKERLELMREHSDGFALAEADLRLRGPGEILGTKQTGLVDYKIADLTRDAGLIPLAQRLAEELSLYYPDLVTQLIQRWRQHKLQYGQVG